MVFIQTGRQTAWCTYRLHGFHTDRLTDCTRGVHKDRPKDSMGVLADKYQYILVVHQLLTKKALAHGLSVIQLGHVHTKDQGPEAIHGHHEQHSRGGGGGQASPILPLDQPAS